MKKVLYVFPVIIFQGLASQTLSFEYDSGGNQVVRQYCASCAPYSKTATNKADLISKEEFPPPAYQAKVYPNPTKDKVNLTWSPELGDMIQKIEYVSYNFTQYREIPFKKGEHRVTLDLSSQPVGMYVVIFHLNTGEKLTYKVLKH
ncbi:hypothetical protein HNP38_003015 [Chryseobacterium defluvii]|uniref:Secreted protein (Por secretion system target) n=1 Tax=Chryseobacterium defluvii TaxID=160396 RepID=A0A840KDU3_9FLAO|nr:T9SS type A sorting domain-containing protein [Chryseobacterium defluvii]MBB4807699.1 hypothetical protein [Chryseobacterium defluvii]